MKGYWYLLTDVYPDGLFGDPAEPAPGGAGPVFGAAGPAAWAPPSVTGPEPPQPEAVPMDHPVPLPASAVETAAPPAAAVPGRLVLSKDGKRLVSLILGVGAATPVALIALLVLQLAQAPSAGSGPASVSAAAGAPATTAPAPTASPTARPAPVPPLSTADWLKGLSSLGAAMSRATVAGNAGNDQVLTSASLRSTAQQLGRCSAELSALGPPAAQLRQVDRLAVRACQGFEQGARYFATAARFMSPDGAATDQGKANELLARGDAGATRGSNLMSAAVADGSVIGPPG
jgi:hypothetical protein